MAQMVLQGLVVQSSDQLVGLDPGRSQLDLTAQATSRFGVAGTRAGRVSIEQRSRQAVLSTAQGGNRVVVKRFDVVRRRGALRSGHVVGTRRLEAGDLGPGLPRSPSEWLGSRPKPAPGQRADQAEEDGPRHGPAQDDPPNARATTRVPQGFRRSLDQRWRRTGILDPHRRRNPARILDPHRRRDHARILDPHRRWNPARLRETGNVRRRDPRGHPRLPDEVGRLDLALAQHGVEHGPRDGSHLAPILSGEIPFGGFTARGRLRFPTARESELDLNPFGGEPGTVFTPPDSCRGSNHARLDQSPQLGG